MAVTEMNRRSASYCALAPFLVVSTVVFALILQVTVIPTEACMATVATPETTTTTIPLTTSTTTTTTTSTTTTTTTTACDTTALTTLPMVEAYAAECVLSPGVCFPITLGTITYSTSGGSSVASCKCSAGHALCFLIAAADLDSLLGSTVTFIANNNKNADGSFNPLTTTPITCTNGVNSIAGKKTTVITCYSAG